jgi:hypothetical protein
MTKRHQSPSTPKVTDKAEAARAERDDWFFDELMTPQPDAAQHYFRNRLKALNEQLSAEDANAEPKYARPKTGEPS